MNGGAIRFPESTTPWFWKTDVRSSSFGISWPEDGTGSESPPHSTRAVGPRPPSLLRDPGLFGQSDRHGQFSEG